MSKEAHDLVQEAIAKLNSDRYHNFSIEMDCPPGNPRPGDLIEGVLDGTGLHVSDFSTGNPFFGHQTWILKEGSPERDIAFTASKPIFKERIKKLHDAGYIRYGTW